MDSIWLMAYIKPGSEKRVTERLAKKQLEYYFPLAIMAGRPTKQPLFRSYLFIKTSQESASNLRQITGVISIAYWLSKPLTVGEAEINYLKHFLEVNVNVTVRTTHADNKNERSVNNDAAPAALYQYNNITKSTSLTLPSLGFILHGESRTAEELPVSSERFIKNTVFKPGKISLKEWLAGG